MRSRAFWILAVVVVLSAAGAGAWLARRLEPVAPEMASGTWLPQARSLGSFALIDQSGAAFTPERLRGAPALLFFGFTRCPDVCPTTLVALSQAQRAAAVPGLRVLFVSIDPARDTPAQLGSYLHAFGPGLLGLTGRNEQIHALAGRLGVAYMRVELPGGDYTMDHVAAVFLLDAAGRMVAVFTPPYDPARLAADLRRAAPFLRASVPRA
jgi:protein SCO1